MGLRINTNVSSLQAQRFLGQAQASVEKSEGKIASGSRINQAADDAAGLSIAEKMRAQTRSLNQAIRNGGDAISMVQTAEGAMNEVSNILIRFRELAIYASSDTIGDTERSFLDKELQQLKSEIGRIAEATEYNGNKLLEYKPNLIEVQIGPDNNPDEDRLFYDALKTSLSPERLRITNLDFQTKTGAQNSLPTIDSAISTVGKARAQAGALQNRISSALNYLRQHVEDVYSSRSRIMDTDMADQTAELTKAQIIANSCFFVMGQANVSGQQALRLLG